jgi:hypothetical protein
MPHPSHIPADLNASPDTELQALTERLRNAPEASNDLIAEAVRDMLRTEAAYLQARSRLYALCGQQVA